MRILIDTNIIIDSVLKREPFRKCSDEVLEMCKNFKAEGCISAHTVNNLFYILRKELDQPKRSRLFADLSRFLYIVPIDFQKLQNAVNNTDFSDVEDCLQTECAIEFKADYIVTRNIRDFGNSIIKAITPENLINISERTHQV